MSVHTVFYQFLSNRKNGAEIQKACKENKSASFNLNGRLKGGLQLDGYLDLFEALKRAICATNHDRFPRGLSMDDTVLLALLRHSSILLGRKSRQDDHGPNDWSDSCSRSACSTLEWIAG